MSRTSSSTLAPIVPAIERNNRSLADQIFRAAASVPMNLAEGQRSQKGNQQKHYAIAHGSANEVKAALRVACAWGWIDRSERALVVMDRLLALLWRLTHRKPRSRDGSGHRDRLLDSSGADLNVVNSRIQCVQVEV
jgi:four helix bundle protein